MQCMQEVEVIAPRTFCSNYQCLVKFVYYLPWNICFFAEDGKTGCTYKTLLLGIPPLLDEKALTAASHLETIDSSTRSTFYHCF